MNRLFLCGKQTRRCRESKEDPKSQYRVPVRTCVIVTEALPIYFEEDIYQPRTFFASFIFRFSSVAALQSSRCPPFLRFQ